MGQRVYIDWNNDGDWGEPEEDVTQRVRGATGIAIERGRDQVRAYAPPMAGRTTFTLDNQDRELSPHRGVFASHVAPGRAVRVEATTPIATPLFTGHLDEPGFQPGVDQRSVRVDSLGPLALLRGQKISTALYENIRTDQALAAILDSAVAPMTTTTALWGYALWDSAVWSVDGWPASRRLLDVGQTVFRWWWLDDEDAFDAAVAVLASEGPGAALYEDAEGRIVFESRQYRTITPRSAVSQATWRDGGAEPCFSEFSYDVRWKDVVNQVEIEWRERTVGDIQTVWDYGSELVLAANEERLLAVAAANPFREAVTPTAAAGDFVVLEGSVVHTGLSRTSGQRCQLRLIAGPGGARLGGLRLRARAVAVATSSTVASTIDTTVSRRDYGVRPYSPPVRAEIDRAVLQDMANAYVGWYQFPHPVIEVGFIGGPHEPGLAARLAQQVARQISDRVTIVEEETGFHADCWVEQINHHIVAAGNVYRTGFGCEKCLATAYAVWDGGAWDSAIWGF